MDREQVIAGMTCLSQSWYSPAAKSRHLGNLLEEFEAKKDREILGGTIWLEQFRAVGPAADGS